MFARINKVLYWQASSNKSEMTRQLKSIKMLYQQLQIPSEEQLLLDDRTSVPATIKQVGVRLARQYDIR